MEILPDVVGCLVAVDEGHVAVHEDDRVIAASSKVHSYIILDHFDGLLASVGLVDLLFDIDSTLAAEDGL